MDISHARGTRSMHRAKFKDQPENLESGTYNVNTRCFLILCGRWGVEEDPHFGARLTADCRELSYSSTLSDSRCTKKSRKTTIWGWSAFHIYHFSIYISLPT